MEGLKERLKDWLRFFLWEKRWGEYWEQQTAKASDQVLAEDWADLLAVGLADLSG